MHSWALALASVLVSVMILSCSTFIVHWSVCVCVYVCVCVCLSVSLSGGVWQESGHATLLMGCLGFSFFAVVLV